MKTCEICGKDLKPRKYRSNGLTYMPLKFCSKPCSIVGRRMRATARAVAVSRIYHVKAIGPQVLIIREMYDSGVPMKDIMARFGISLDDIYSALRRSGPYTPRGIEFRQIGLAKAQAANRLKFSAK